MKSRIGRILKRIASVMAAVGLVVVVYYGIRITQARRVTGALVGPALASQSDALGVYDLTEEQLHILLAVQDPGFFDHAGTDFSGGTMTTITQALVKVYYFDQFKPGFRKIEQSLIARYALDRLVSKEDQLVLFLNVSYLGTVDGHEIHGFQDGALTYFGRSLGSLTGDEFIALVAMLAGPNHFNPVRNPKALERRVGQIQRLLAGECERGGLLKLGENCWSE